jgi:hypothetical protein
MKTCSTQQKIYADSLVAKNSFHVEAFEQMNNLLVMKRKDCSMSFKWSFLGNNCWYITLNPRWSTPSWETLKAIILWIEELGILTKTLFTSYCSDFWPWWEMSGALEEACKRSTDHEAKEALCSNALDASWRRIWGTKTNLILWYTKLANYLEKYREERRISLNVIGSSIKLVII